MKPKQHHQTRHPGHLVMTLFIAFCPFKRRFDVLGNLLGSSAQHRLSLPFAVDTVEGEPLPAAVTAGLGLQFRFDEVADDLRRVLVPQ